MLFVHILYSLAYFMIVMPCVYLIPGQLQTELEERHEEILKKVQRDHASVIQAARLELDRAVEISKQKASRHQASTMFSFTIFLL